MEYPSNPSTSTYPRVGERRWVNGEFEVEVLCYEWRYGAEGQVEMARVLLDPERCTYDPNDPDRNTNHQDPKRLLTESEMARQSIALAHWHEQQAVNAQRNLDRAKANAEVAARRAQDVVRKVPGMEALGTIAHPSAWLEELEAVLNGSLVTPQHEISGPWTAPEADDPVDVRLKFAIASAIEEAARNARDDWTHIDCPARAGVIVRQFLPQIEESLKAEVAKGLGLDTRNRTQRLMARAKERRRG